MPGTSGSGGGGGAGGEAGKTGSQSTAAGASRSTGNSDQNTGGSSAAAGAAPAATGTAGTSSGGGTGAGTGTTGQRSRTACINCRATKQKCDGPSRIPCRRCELYNLECQYTDVPPRQAVKRKIEDTGDVLVSQPAPRPAAIVPTDVAGTILSRLEELTERTKGVEDVLRYQLQSSRPTALPGMGELGLPDTLPAGSNMRGGNPVSAVAEPFRSIDEPSGPLLPGNSTGQHSGSAYANTTGLGPLTPTPDAIARGLITIEQAQRYFAFFVEHCRYWVHGFVPSQLNDCMRVRQTSPLLFGAVICVSSYFLDAANGEAGLQLYLNLVALTNETLAPIIMSPDNAELNDEFILGIALCIIWKAPRIDTRRLGFADFPRMQHLAKLNNSTTYFLSGIAGRAARVNGLNRSPASLMAGDISPAALSRARLWLWMCFVDAHGCMQNGRAASIDITDSLKLTRTFASLNDHPTDVELCALLEIASVYRTFHGTSEDDRTNLPALAQANADLDSITSYWYQHYPRLHYEGAFVTQFIAPFHRLVINADVYRSWAVRDLAAKEKGATEEAVLSHEEAKYLMIGVESAQTLLLYLSLNARADNGRRIPRFEDPQYWKDGMPIYKPMEPDVDHARHIRTAVDTVVTVIITFSAMFLAKLRAANLMRCDLTVVTPANPIKDYESDSRGQIALYSKFFRMLELASDFLEMVAPNPGHPCLTQSRVLRSLLSAGTNRAQTYQAGQTSASVQNLANASKSHMQQATNLPQTLVQPQLQQNQQSALPRYPHSLLGQATVDHSANSPIASGSEWPQVPGLLQPQQSLNDGNLNDMLAGVGQPGPGLVTSFLGGDEWSMLMNSLGLQQQ